MPIINRYNFNTFKLEDFLILHLTILACAEIAKKMDRLKECWTDFKEPWTDFKEPWTDFKEPWTDLRKQWTDFKDNFNSFLPKKYKLRLG